MSRFIECVGGTPEWMQLRSGLITASNFGEICNLVGGLNEQQQIYVDAILKDGIDEKTALTLAGYKNKPTSETVKRALNGEVIVKEFSDTAKRYAGDLSLERISGAPYGTPPKTWLLERGHIMEAHARRLYEGRTGTFVTEAGICVDDHGFGYSTDGLVDDDGLIEIKCPIDSVKVESLFVAEDFSEYIHQMQGGMWITVRKWCDLIVYVPALESTGNDLFVKRIHRDDSFIEIMVETLARFKDLVNEKESFFRSFNVPQLKLAA